MEFVERETRVLNKPISEYICIPIATEFVAPSQNAWALMGLLATCSSRDQAISDGIAYHVDKLTDIKGTGASWKEHTFTGTGFPNHFYIGYSLYRHYFLLMALGRYVTAVDRESRRTQAF
jgi:squalene cyclase